MILMYLLRFSLKKETFLFFYIRRNLMVKFDGRHYHLPKIEKGVAVFLERLLKGQSPYGL